MQAHLKVLSISHTKAPIEVREAFYLSTEQCRSLSTQIHEVLGLDEVLVLSTCNRTEIYVVTEAEVFEQLAKLLCIEKGLPCAHAFYKVMEWIAQPRTAVQHLFEVSMGLQSQVIGDLQISHQVKQAYALATELQLAGPFMHRLLHTIFHTNKRVQQETAYRDGAASVSYAAADLASELTSILSAPSVLVIGLGEMGHDTAKQFVDSKFARVAVMNRTHAKAQAFAAEHGVEAIPFENLAQAIHDFHVVVCAASAPQPIITAEMMGTASSKSHRFLIDLCVPRTIDRAVDHIPGIIVYDIDEIRARTDETLRQRLAAVPKVQAIIAEDLAGFADWSRELSISPTIQRLKEALEQIRSEEVSRFVKGINPQEAELIDKVTKSMVNKIIKLPVLQLKAACKRGEQEDLIEMLNDLFDLEKAKARH